MIKLVACDLDGTLLNGEHTLSKEDALVIQQLEKANVQFMVATGRSYEGAKDIIEEHGIFCDYVVLNGACMYSQKEGIQLEIPLEQDMLRPLLAVLKEEDACFHMNTKEGSVTLDAKRSKEEALQHFIRNGIEERVANDMVEKGKFSAFDIEVSDIDEYLASQPSVYKVELFAVSAQHQQQLLKRLSQINGLEITNSVADNIEITNQSAQKGSTLLTYCELHGIKKEEVLVFGDSLNDTNMIQSFPYSFAVRNATAKIIEYANYITDTNIEHGVSKVLQHIVQQPCDMEFLKNFKKDTI